MADFLFKILFFLFFAVQIILAFHLLLPFLLLVIHLLFTGNKKIINGKYIKTENKEYDFAAIATVHKDTRFILPLIDSFLKQTYSNFILYVIADDCDISSLNVNNSNVRLLKPEPALNAKIKSIKYAADRFERDHDVMIVFDSDNLVHPAYLENLNNYFCCGFKAVQTHMLSKNTETIYSRLDSIGHIYNTFTERQARMELGLSSCILGLGIAIDTKLYKKVMYKDELGGFDKKLQADLIDNTQQLAFAKEAIVYDEKVDDGNTLERQRTRWIYTYFKYFKINFRLFLRGLMQLNFNKVYFAFSALRPPLFITLALAFVLTIIDFFINPLTGFIFTGIIFLFALSFVLIVLTQSRQKGMAEALLYIPVIVFRQISAFLKLKKAKSDFLKTEHTKVLYIDDVLRNEAV